MKIPIAILIGSEEFAQGTVTLKNLKLGAELQEKKGAVQGVEREEWLKLSRTAQKTVSLDSLEQEIKAMLV